MFVEQIKIFVMKKNLLLTLFLTILSGALYAQSGTLSGRVLDGETGEPLPFTTVAAFTGSELVTGTTTGDNGRFSLELPYGTYRVVIQFLSYQEKTFPTVSLSADKPAHNFGDVALAEAEETLQAVEVEAQAPEMQLSLDKKIFSVQDNLAVKGGSATDVLDNIPSVNVDTEGNVSLRGSENVRILIDGKPSGLTGANALRQLPAELIERVEVITNPSARYEAQGMAGIINIVLKKNQKNGLNGSFDVTAGYPHNYGLGANINVRRKAANFFVNLSTRYRENPGGGFTNNRYDSQRILSLSDEEEPLTYNRLNQDRERMRTGWSHNIRLGSDVYLNQHNTLTGSFLYSTGPGVNTSSLTNNFLLGQNLQIFSLREEVENEQDQNLEWALDYRKTFDKKDRLLTGTVQYRLRTEEELADFNERYFLPGREPAPRMPDIQRSDNDESQQNTLIQFDYVDPIGDKGQWEMGTRNSFRRINTDYRVDSLSGGTYFPMDRFNNNFEYVEDIYALYAQLGMKHEPFSYQLGLRAEYSVIDTELKTTGEENSRDYLNLFPSAFLTYSFSKLSSLQLSYSRRVRRPGFRELNPFRSFTDPRNIRLGNPNLDPEFTHSMELGYLRNFSKGSLTSSLFYRHTEGLIQWYSTLEATPGEGTDDQENITIINQPLNLGTRDDLGVELVGSFDLNKWWTINQSLNVFHSTTNASNIDQELATRENLSVQTLGWQTRFNSRMRLGKGLNLQQTFFYMGPQDMPQGRRLSMYMLNLGASKDILNNKATISLSVDDLLNSRKWRMERLGTGFTSESEFQWRRRSVSINFNYRLNQDRRSSRKDNRQDRQERQEGNGEEMGEF
ncbi:Outer membrane cobalamin translocator [Cesiribacter andamanensis AMV16]|uniref:Outer membrane cobalamin translocator n=2 Tax=Cesiribacter TaxID=1133570 RepID=M7NA10_9BACT|nr:Outer membrane cobalamin translocator [Cesiribacter andamanensis AMV16]